MYKLPELQFKYQDFEPFIDTHTMGLHYNKHEKKYLDNLNMLLSKNNYTYNYNLNELVYHLDEFPVSDREDILFNLGGVLNHNLYWNGISTNNYRPKGKLKDKIDNKYGSFDNFFNLFMDEALKLKGSGYTTLVFKDKDIEIMNFSNQDIPQFFGYIPLFNIDLWEHAYYLNYKNDKSKYLENFKQIADFSFASDIYNNLIERIVF